MNMSVHSISIIKSDSSKSPSYLTVKLQRSQLQNVLDTINTKGSEERGGPQNYRPEAACRV